MGNAASQQATGNVELVLEEKQAAPCLSYLNAKSRTDPLCAAAKTKNLNTFKRLISGRNSQLNKKDDQGYTPSHYCVLSQWPEGLQAIVEANGDINATSAQGYSPLQVAAYLGATACVQILITAGANIESKTARNATALILAAQQGAVSKDALSLLLEAGADVSHCGFHNRTALQVAVHAHGREEVITMLTSHGANPSASHPETHNNAPLHTAAHLQRYGAVRALLTAGADADAVNEMGLTPLMEVYMANTTQGESVKRCMARDLQRYGADLNATVPDKGFTALHFAVAHSNHEVTVHNLLQLGIDATIGIDLLPSQTQNTMLHIVAKRGWATVTRLLLEAGADINARNKEGFAPLHLAVINKRPAVIKTLLDYGVDAQQRGPDIWPTYDHWKVKRGMAAMQALMGGPIPLAGIQDLLASLNHIEETMSTVDLACAVVQDIPALEAFIDAGVKPSAEAVALAVQCKPILQTIVDRPHWTPELHAQLPPRFKAHVRTLLLTLKAASRQTNRNPLPSLPPDAVACILTQAAFPVSQWATGGYGARWLDSQCVKETTEVRREGDDEGQGGGAAGAHNNNPAMPAHMPQVMHIMPEIMEQVLNHIQEQVAGNGVQAGAMLAQIPGGPGAFPGAGGAQVMVNFAGGLGGGGAGNNAFNDVENAMIEFDFNLPMEGFGGPGMLPGMPPFAEMMAGMMAGMGMMPNFGGGGGGNGGGGIGIGGLGPMMAGMGPFPMMFHPAMMAGLMGGGLPFDSDDEDEEGEEEQEEEEDNDNGGSDDDDDDDEGGGMPMLPPGLQQMAEHAMMQMGGLMGMPLPMPPGFGGPGGWQPHGHGGGGGGNNNGGGVQQQPQQPPAAPSTGPSAGDTRPRRSTRSATATATEQQQQRADEAGPSDTRNVRRRGRGAAAVQPVEEEEEAGPSARAARYSLRSRGTQEDSSSSDDDEEAGGRAAKRRRTSQ